MSKKDTHLITLSTELINPGFALDGTGHSETIKVVGVSATIIGVKFIGSPAEDDIDIVGHNGCYIGPNDHSQSNAKQSITVKGGAKNTHIAGKWKKVVLGQYSNYDRWFKGKKTCGTILETDSEGLVEIWHAEVPDDIPPGVRIRRIPRLIVWAYFLFRSIQQTFSPPPK